MNNDKQLENILDKVYILSSLHKNLEDILGFEIYVPNLYIEAFTHSSFAYENGTKNYELLEFVGDSLLNLYVAEYLHKNIYESVGMLSKLRASLVSTENLVKIALSLQLDKQILFSNSMKKNATRHKVYADVIESLIAAIYYDKGDQFAREFVQKHIIVSLENVKQHLEHCVDYKTVLQETLQAKIVNPKIEYQCVSQTGTSDQPIFEIELYIQNEKQGVAKGSSKKQAEQLCAKNYLEKYNSED